MSTWPAAPDPVVAPQEIPEQPLLPRLKLLHVITRFEAGAGGNTLLAATSADHGQYDVWVAGCPGGPLWARAAAAGIRTVELAGFHEYISPREDLAVLVQLIRLMRRERFTIVHTHSAKGGFLGRVAAWVTRVPVVVHTFHSFAVDGQMGRLRRAAYLGLERLVRRTTHMSLAVAPQVARQAVELRLATPGQIEVAPSAVELDSLPESADETARSELGLDPDAVVVGTVGRIDLQKAPLDFVRMAAAVAEDRPETRFVMIGDGPLRAEAEREAARLGVTIVFTGFMPHAARLAAAFDVYVVSSLYEGLGRALTEALASGRPVVATAVNGVPDLVRPGATGLLAPPGSPEQLARGVLWLLDHPAAAARMGTAAQERVRHAFSPTVMCAVHERIYRRLLGQPEDPDGLGTDSTSPSRDALWTLAH